MSDRTDWDWLRLIPSSDYHQLALIGWPGWDKVDDGPPYVSLTFVMGQGKQSGEIAAEWDDLSKGAFWYRDYTSTHIPFVAEGESYRSIFVFQFIEDRDEFIKWYSPLDP